MDARAPPEWGLGTVLVNLQARMHLGCTVGIDASQLIYMQRRGSDVQASSSFLSRRIRQWYMGHLKCYPHRPAYSIDRLSQIKSSTSPRPLLRDKAWQISPLASVGQAGLGRD